MEKPLLVFDGDCYFCSLWVERWRILAQNKVLVEPYQTAAARFPEIPEENFKKSIYFFEEGRTSRAAEAAFRVLAYNSKNKLWLWFYQNISMFRIFTEWCYSLVATRRVFFSKMTRFFWGNDLRPDSYFTSRPFFFRGLALVYAVAFASLGFQIAGVLGSKGILPVQTFLDAVRRHFGNVIVDVYYVPSVFWFNSSDFYLKVVCAAGMVFSLFLFAGVAVRTCLFLLWFFYLSLVTTGQDFLSFQWDTLLLEAGFLSLFWAPRQKGFLT